MKSIDRRSFLTGLSATPVLLQCSLSGAQAAAAGFKLGVASYSFRKFNRTQAIAMVKQLNTPYINIKEFHLLLRSTPDEIDVARKEFQEAGLIILGVVTSRFCWMTTPISGTSSNTRNWPECQSSFVRRLRERSPNWSAS